MGCSLKRPGNTFKITTGDYHTGYIHWRILVMLLFDNTANVSFRQSSPLSQEDASRKNGLWMSLWKNLLED